MPTVPVCGCRRVCRGCPGRLRSRCLWNAGCGFGNGRRFSPAGAAVNLSVARDVEVVADVAEAAAGCARGGSRQSSGARLGRGRAVNDGKRDDSHRPVKELKPNTPARAVATATMVLRTMPHTDFDFVLMFFWC